MWTKKDINVTRKSIDKVTESKKKEKLFANNPELNQLKKYISTFPPLINRRNDNKKVKNINRTDINLLPFIPILLPNKKEIKKLKNGKNNIKRYI